MMYYIACDVQVHFASVYVWMGERAKCFTALKVGRLEKHFIDTSLFIISNSGISSGTNSYNKCQEIKMDNDSGTVWFSSAADINWSHKSTFPLW